MPQGRTLNRRESLHEIQQGGVWDVLILGGGANGLGCALDASLRGYRTLLLEKNDFAAGTSSRSSKMIHGGVRYLKRGDIPMVRSALRERDILLRNTGGLVKEQRFIIPLYSVIDLGLYMAGMRVYDLLAQGQQMKRSQFLSAAAVRQCLPGLCSIGLKGGIAYSDGHFDDARLALSIAQGAARQGATLMNYASAVGLLKASRAGKVEGVMVHDEHTHQEYEIRSRLIINATGVFVDSILAMDNPHLRKLHRISQGSHIVLPAEFLPGDYAMLIPKTSDGRVLFCLPWYGRLLIGTTDMEMTRATEEPHPQERELNFLLNTCSRYLARKPDFTAILSMFSGQRPLPDRYGSKPTKQLSREHRIDISSSGLVSILGGKWTTYRAVAQEALDKGLASIGDECRSHSTDMVKLGELGTQMSEIEEEDPKNRELISPHFPYKIAQIIAAVRYEMAATLTDVMARRTRMLLLDVRKARQCAPQVAHIMAKELGEKEPWIQRQQKDFYQLTRQYLP